MGCNSSKPAMVAETEGDGKAFLEKYAVDRILGQGEFGVVKLVHEKRADGSDGPSLAAKILRKGMVFKDNTLYAAIKPKVLKIECKILRTLQGKHYTLKLRGVYESPSVIYIVTDHCEGGDMFQYVSDNYGESGLRTEDVSRISFQLFDAVNHCAKYGIIHRDIKPENIMFKEAKKGSDLVLIDFGSGTMSTDEEVQAESAPKPCEQANGDILSLFATFAGSAFYISPEMFQRNYTLKTDVWSAGVTIYVLVAGYPSKDLQDAFNQLQNSKAPEERISQLESLPNMPEMPATFFEMLENALVFRHKKRMSAGGILDCEFIRFHKEHALEENDNSKDFRIRRTSSVVVQGAASRHIEMRLYGRYEREITALLASVLPRRDLKQLLKKIDALIASSPEEHMEVEQAVSEVVANKKRLQIVRVDELMVIMTDLKFHYVIKLMKDQAHGGDYSEYAYHVAILRQFYTYDEEEQSTNKKGYSPGMDNSMTRKLNTVMVSRGEKAAMNNMDSTSHSMQLDGDDRGINSVHGNNVWDSIKKQMANKNAQANSMSRTHSSPDLANSSHM